MLAALSRFSARFPMRCCRVGPHFATTLSEIEQFSQAYRESLSALAIF